LSRRHQTPGWGGIVLSFRSGGIWGRDSKKHVISRTVVSIFTRKVSEISEVCKDYIVR
jgi:hypothetical protein